MGELRRLTNFEVRIKLDSKHFITVTVIGNPKWSDEGSPCYANINFHINVSIFKPEILNVIIL